ncbi:MAG TPA: peroxide stress protein YaaA [Actinomycetales bacterium]|nr:peroxide stress protein YaaA [Actinomycetales bacterium]
MLVLLPPSEGKTPAASRRRRPVDLDALSWPELSASRSTVIAAVAEVSARPDALQVLGVGASLAAEVERNTRLLTEPAVPVTELYSGVLYEALDLDSLPVGARRRAGRWLVVLSGLWGALRLSDHVPAYRLSMGVSLPATGPLAAFWRETLDEPLRAAAGHGVVVDCRSSTYRAAWSPKADLAERTIAVRVLREDDGRRRVVSHQAKRTRGEVVRHLLTRDAREPRTPRAVADAVAETWACELHAPTRAGASWTLDVVVPAAPSGR